MNTFSYKQLIVWQKAIVLLKHVYTITNKLPREEDYNLKMQLRRAALSVSSNIAEGSARKSQKDRRRFYEISRSSLIEIDSQLEAGLILAYFEERDCENVNNIILEEYKMLSTMIASCGE